MSITGWTRAFPFSPRRCRADPAILRIFQTSREALPDESRWRDRLTADWTRERDHRPAEPARLEPEASDPWPARAAAAAVSALDLGHVTGISYLLKIAAVLVAVAGDMVIFWWVLVNAVLE